MTSPARLGASHLLRLALRALGGRVSIPLSSLRSRITSLSDKVAVDIEPAPPGLRVRGETHALGAPIAFVARVDFDGVGVSGEARTIRVLLSEVVLSTDEDAPGPLAEAIRTGMIDTANPATLIGNMTSLPEMIIEAEGRELVVDLMKIPALRRDEALRAALAAATSYVGVSGIRVEHDAIELRLGVLPGGSKEAALGTARAALTPVVRYLWPEGPS